VATGHEVDRGALLLAIAERLDQLLVDLQARRHAALEAMFRERLGWFGRRVVIDAGTNHEGILTALDFQQLTLDGARSWSLASVRAIRPAP
jgi:hypothetical protein